MTATLPGPTILVADDDPEVREMLGFALRHWGFEVVAAPDGDAALAILRSPQAPRVAVLDWEMPGLTGPEVCTQVRQDGGTDLVLLVLTGRGRPEDASAALAAGADALLTKPCDLATLRFRLVAATQRPVRATA